MSKHSIRAGDVAGLLVRLAQLKEKVRGRDRSAEFQRHKNCGKICLDSGRRIGSVSCNLHGRLQSGWFSNLTLPSAPVAIQTPMGSFTSYLLPVSRRTRPPHHCLRAWRAGQISPYEGCVAERRSVRRSVRQGRKEKTALAAASLIDNTIMLTLRFVGTFQSVARVSEKLNAASFAQRDHSGQITRRTCTGT